MAPQVTIPPEDFSTRRTLVRFEVGVRQQVSLEVGALVEAARTDRTLVRRFLQVKDPVDGQSARLAESFAAISALERLLLRVDVTARQKQNSVKFSFKFCRHFYFIQRIQCLT